mgnify:CR=1 FL=1
MNQQPDKLFHEKLHGYSQPVSSGTWNRISEIACRKTGPNFRIRIAATVLLLVTSGIFFYPALRKKAADPLSGNKGFPENQKRAEVKSHSANNAQVDPPVDRMHHVMEDAARLPVVTQANDGTRADRVPVNDQENAVSIINLPDDHDMENSSSLVFTQPPLKEHTSKAKNIKIVFTIEEVNEKYFGKIKDAEATPVAKETSGIKKLLDKAYELKNNQDLLGDLRQRKNEILAVNFKNEKERTEND